MNTAHDRAERELLGTVLHAHPEAAERAAGVTESDFRVDAHRRIWRAMTALWDDGRPADLVRVANWLRRKGWLDDSGVGTAFYAATVRENALRRRLAGEGRRLAQLAEEGGVPAVELLGDARSRLEGLASGLVAAGTDTRPS
jgi:replicative DNA helicase